MVLVFFTSLIVMCHYRNRMNHKIWNIAFIVADIAFYFAWNYASYERGWLKEGWMNLENISPMVCMVMALTPLMNDKVRQAAYDTLSGFSVGLFFALMISPEYAYLFDFNIEANFSYAAESACHLLVALFGIYLVISKQVKPGLESWVRSLIFSFSIIGFGVFLNYVFHKTYFGMNPYGSSAIYMLDIFHSHDATLAAYIAGVLIVLTVGMQCMYMLAKALDRIGASEGDADVEKKAESVSREGKKVYLFDFDGTLVDSMQAYECENDILAKDGVAETLTELRRRGIRLNVLTASPHSMLDPGLKRVGLYGMFENVWSCDDFGIGKDNPEIYRLAAEKLGVSVGEVIFLDDSIEAIKTARAAGMETCGVYDPSSADLVTEMMCEADGYVHNLKELLIDTEEPENEE